MKKISLSSIVLSIVLGTVVLLSACDSPSPKKAKYFHVRGEAQGTTYSVKYQDPQARNFQSVLDSIFAEMDQSISNYQEGSLIRQVNESDSMHAIDRHFFTLLLRSQWAHRVSEGAFDPTIWPLMQFWGFGSEKVQEIDTVDSTALQAVLNLVGLDKVKLYDGRRTFSIQDAMASSYLPDFWQVVKTVPGLQLDFNALGQGYTVDVIAERLEQLGLEHYYVEVGGEVRVKGLNPNGVLWTTGIVKPVEDKQAMDLMATLPLDNQSVTTSGNYRKFYEKNGVKFAHTINPQTGATSRHNLLSATVVAPDCTMADALSTVCMVIGMEKALELIEPIEGVELFLVYATEDGKMATYTSSGIASQLKLGE